MRRLGVLILVCGTVAAAIGPASARVATSPAGAKLPPLAGRVQVASPGSQLWVARYSGPQFGADASSVGVSPNGSTVYVTGESLGSGTGDDYATVAYDTVTGSQLWSARYNGPGNADDSALALGVSPDGSKVFVTGTSYGVGTGQDYATVAYDAASGNQLWVTRYNGPGNSGDQAYALTVSPDDSKVFVTGWSTGAAQNEEYATLAYDAGSGNQLWATRYTGPGGQDDVAHAVAVSPDGSKVFVTGQSLGSGTGIDYATIAYRAATGSQLWVARYNGPASSDDVAHALAVSRDGSKVFVTGESFGANTGWDYATVAYHAVSGGQLWAARYSGREPGGQDGAVAVAVSPDDSDVFVTGESSGASSGFNYATVAYNAAIGRQLWKAGYAHSGDDTAVAFALSPDGSTVYVTGSSVSRGNSAYATLAYDTVSGSKLWVTRYGPAKSYSQAAALALSPDGSTLYVTGSSAGDYATIAYAAR